MPFAMMAREMQYYGDAQGIQLEYRIFHCGMVMMREVTLALMRRQQRNRSDCIAQPLPLSKIPSVLQLPIFQISMILQLPIIDCREESKG